MEEGRQAKQVQVVHSFAFVVLQCGVCCLCVVEFAVAGGPGVVLRVRTWSPA